MAQKYFTPATFEFLKKLEKNNKREWFEKNKQAYEDLIRTPALSFIADISIPLADVSPHFYAIPKKVGGSLMRIQRDVRFGKDKRPYKTNVGIQFRHALGKDVHAPGYYVHLEPGECFLGVGIWRPEAPVLKKIREGIVENEKAWLTASRDKKFKRNFELTGESLVNPPRGYPKDHALIEDLKRKDFIAICEINQDTVTSKKFQADVLKQFSNATPFMQYLCKTLQLQF